MVVKGIAFKLSTYGVKYDAANLRQPKALSENIILETPEAMRSTEDHLKEKKKGVLTRNSPPKLLLTVSLLYCV